MQVVKRGDAACARKIDLVALGNAEVIDSVGAAAVSPYESVRTTTAGQSVVTGTAIQDVVAIPAADRVVAITAQQRVGALTAGDQIVAGSPVNPELISSDSEQGRIDHVVAVETAMMVGLSVASVLVTSMFAPRPLDGDDTRDLPIAEP